MILEEGEDAKFQSQNIRIRIFRKMERCRCKFAISGLQINFSSGKTLGGGSEINSGLFHNIDEKFIDDWTKNIKPKILITIRWLNLIKKFKILNVSENQNFSNE